jgi:hypothetical protein
MHQVAQRMKGFNSIKTGQQPFLTKEGILLCRLMMSEGILLAAVKQQLINKCMRQA